jgi:SNF2 family DNA or RNA helicase
LNAKNYTILSDVKVKVDKDLRDKVDELMSLLEKDGKFLIFSEFDNTFKMVMKSLEKNNIPFKTLKGAENTIHSTLDEFKNGTIKVLLLNAKFYGSGLNITELYRYCIYASYGSRT